MLWLLVRLDIGWWLLCLAIQGVVVCVCVSPLFPWCIVAVWLANVHRPNSLRVMVSSDSFFPLSLINGCTDKQTSWVKRSSSARGGGGWDRKRWRLYPSCCWLPCFLHRCLMCVCPVRSWVYLPWGIPLCPIYSSLFEKHFSSEQTHLLYMSRFPVWVQRKRSGVIFEKVRLHIGHAL